jgi:hypothetical protein
LKPDIDNDYLLLQHVKFITKIDWKNGDSFRKLPLVPEDLASYDALKDNIGQGKMLGPLFHYSGFLQYIMNSSHHYSGCVLRKKYKDYPPASWPYAFACANEAVISLENIQICRYA